MRSRGPRRRGCWMKKARAEEAKTGRFLECGALALNREGRAYALFGPWTSLYAAASRRGPPMGAFDECDPEGATQNARSCGLRGPNG